MSNQTTATATAYNPWNTPNSARQAYGAEGKPITLYPTRTEAIEREIIDLLEVFLESSDLGGRENVPTYFAVDAIADRVLAAHPAPGGGVAYGLEQPLPYDVLWEICDENAR